MFEQDVYLPSLATGQNLFDESSLTHTWPDTKGAESKSLDCRTLPLTPRVITVCIFQILVCLKMGYIHKKMPELTFELEKHIETSLDLVVPPFS